MELRKLIAVETMQFWRKNKKFTKVYSSNGANPVYQFEYENRLFAVYMSYVGAPSCVADIEDTLSLINTDKYVVFGGAGCLDKEIARYIA